jgi:hypothetical protein
MLSLIREANGEYRVGLEAALEIAQPDYQSVHAEKYA